MEHSVSESSFAATSLRSQSEMYMSIVGTKAIVRSQNFKEKLQEFKEFVVNPTNKTIFNRTPKDWLFYILLHLCVLLASVGAGVAFMGIFYAWILDWNEPTMQASHAIINSPGMGFRPQPDHTSTLIRFVKGDVSTYSHYMGDLEAYLNFYENIYQEGENYIDCSTMVTRPREEIEKVCRFNIEYLGPDCVKQKNFGFEDGQPCVLLKLNKIYNWEPQVRFNRNITRTPAVRVECEGETPMDRENIGAVSYNPPEGFAIKYFPYRNQQGFRSPIVFVRFENITPGILVMVTCRAFADNIQQSEHDMIGRVHFEILVD